MNSVDMQLSWAAYPFASIGGVRFTAGESVEGVRKRTWSSRRCSSVFTAVIGGRSRYGVINKFITRTDGVGEEYAVVTWFPKPFYPYHTPLITCLRDMDPSNDLGCVMSIRDIDTCGVCISRCDDESCWYVYRLEGVDTVLN